MNENNKKPATIVVSAPSGAGKTTLNYKLMEQRSDVELVVSHTTRSPRKGEVEGEHYYFTNKDHFETLVKTNSFLEWANVHGNLYGTSFFELERIQKKGNIPLLEIDVQGWIEAKKHLEGALSIFILPPSIKSLWERLEGRGSDNLATRINRFKNAVNEIENSTHYDYFVVNDNLDRALQQYMSIVNSDFTDKESIASSANFAKVLLQEFKESNWVKELLKDGGN